MDDRLYFTVVYDDGSVDGLSLSPDDLAFLDPHIFNEEKVQHVAALVRETAE